MGNLNSVSQGDAAIARVNVAGGVPSFAMNRGFSAIADTGAGVVTLTLKDAQDLATYGTVTVTPILATSAWANVTITDATTIVVRTWDAGGAADNVSFFIRVTPVGPA